MARYRIRKTPEGWFKVQRKNCLGFWCYLTEWVLGDDKVPIIFLTVEVARAAICRDLHQRYAKEFTLEEYRI